MLYRIAADLVALVHFFFILFVIFGGILVVRNPRFGWFHLPIAIWGTLIEFTSWSCPLTPLENELRRRGGDAGYSGGFIDHYIMPVIYPPGLTRGAQLAIGCAVLLVNGLVYWKVIQRVRGV
ncbi:MAG TPA: DUF2784 domain-containing protein [Thermoanaerobaculia bacterium]